MTKELTCIICPRGCNIKVEMDEKEIKSIEGNTCPRGYEYANTEMTHPMRTITTTVKVKNGGVVPVKTDKPIPKELIFKCMEKINKIEVDNLVKIGDIVLTNLLDLEVNVVATANAY